MSDAHASSSIPASVARTAHEVVDSREQELVELTSVRERITSISSCYGDV